MKTVYIDKEKIGTWRVRRIARKLYKQSKKEEIVVALSKKLMENEILIEYLKKYNIKILNGRWLFKFLIFDILDYIFMDRNCTIEELSLAILMDKSDEIILQQISEIAKRTKIFKIITKNKTSYTHIENELFNQEGIAIEITNNKEKSLSNIDIVLNFDFNEERLASYKINQDAIIINLGQKLRLNKDVFCERIINDYEIDFNEEKYNININKNNFERNILYESYIYRRDNFTNVRKQLKKDNIKISKIA